MSRRVTRPAFRGSTPAWVVLVVGLLLSLVWAGWVRRVLTARAAAQVEADAAKVRHDLADGFQAYDEMMIGMRGLVLARGGLDLRTFRAYAHDLKVFERHHGLLAVSFGYFLDRGELPAFERRMRAEWASEGVDFRVRPAGERDAYFVLAYTEPLEGSREVIGLDTLALPGNRVTLEEAVRTGEVVASGPMNVVQYAGSDPGLILRLAVFRPGSRRALGCINSVFRASRFIEDTLGTAGLERCAVTLADRGPSAAGPGAPRTVFEAADAPAGAWLRLLKPCPASTAVLDLHGRLWEVRVAARRAAMGEGVWLQPAAALAVGLLGTLLLAGILQAQTRVVQRARRLAGRMALRFHEGEERYRNIVDRAPMGIYRRDLAGSFVFFNRGLCQIYGCSGPEEFRRDYATVAQRWVHPEEHDRFIRILLEQHRVEGFEAEIRLRDGRIRWHLIHAYLDEADPGHFEGFATDVTDLKTAEAERLRIQDLLHQSQKMDAIGQLAGGVAHDFNNMLMGILGAADVLQSSGNDLPQETRDRFVEIIASAASRAADLTAKLLTAARKADKTLVLLDLAALVQDTAALLERTLDKRIVIAVENRAERSVVCGDASQLSNVFMNMGINAGHAMPEGGRLTFRLRDVDLDAAFCAGSAFGILPGPYVEVAVQDTGHGIPPQILGRIFEPFFTTKGPGKGTGLGLAAAYGSIQDHLGAIEVETREGEGTTFRVYLPLSLETPVGPVPDEEVVPGHGTVLLVEDEELLRETARTILEHLGYTVLEAADGAQGAALFEARHGDLAAVILDMVMPVMGGRQAFERMKAIDPGVPVLLASGFSREADLEALRGLGLAGFLQKPFRISDLSQALARALRGA